MKVMLLIPHVAGGGGERVLAELSQAIGQECILVVFEEAFSYPFSGKVVSLNVPMGHRTRLRRAYDTFRRWHRLRRVLRAERPAVVISFMGEANLLNALLSPNPVVTVHNHLSSTYRMRSRVEALLIRMLVTRLYRRTTVVAVSEAVRQDLIDAFRVPPRRVSVIPNSVNAKRIGALATEPVATPWNPGEPVLITAGRLVREKGQWHLIRAFAEVRKQIPCQLAIVGSGELAAYLRATSEALGIAEHTYFLGWQSNPFSLFAASTIFVQPSLTEGFGLALVEAMACGLPVIATDCPGGVREVLAPGESEECGILVPALDGQFYDNDQPCTSSERAMAQAIVTLLADKTRRADLAAAGARRAEAFANGTFVERYRQLIASTTRDS